MTGYVGCGTGTALICHSKGDVMRVRRVFMCT